MKRSAAKFWFLTFFLLVCVVDHRQKFELSLLGLEIRLTSQRNQMSQERWDDPVKRTVELPISGARRLGGSGG